MSVNTELVIDVLAQIQRQPERWDQRDWAIDHPCGTAYCFAGWTCVLSGYELYGGTGLMATKFAEATRLTPIVAMTLLGLDNDGGLFAAHNTLDDLYDICADLMGVEVSVLRDKVRDRV